MDRAAFDSLDREGLIGVALAQAEAIERLSALVAQLQAKLDRPPKTPDNSSIPPSQVHKKTTEFVKNRRKKKPHSGAHRPLHPNPTQQRDVMASVCQHCGADVSQSPQEPCEAYDRVEIPPIAPDITRVRLHGGVCPCCAGRFKAEAPAGLEPGSPFGPNLRAFVIYLRFTQNVGFERLSRLMANVFGLGISEGALVNILAPPSAPGCCRAA
jgi:transposase